MHTQIAIFLYQFRKFDGDLVVWVYESEPVKKCFDASSFSGTYRFAEQFLPRCFGVVQGPLWITEELQRIAISAKPVNENTSVHQGGGKLFPRLSRITHSML